MNELYDPNQFFAPKTQAQPLEFLGQNPAGWASNNNEARHLGAPSL